MKNNNLTPKQIVAELDKHIIGQFEAKRAVASALRNRWRRMQLDEHLRKEITPKNILMIGPTGVGKTEIARRLATITKAPFIKVEATKFTEVGYMGKDVDSIIRDLAENAAIMIENDVSLDDKEAEKQIEAEALEKVVDHYVTPLYDEQGNPMRSPSVARDRFREKILSGDLDDRKINIEVEESKNAPDFNPFEQGGLSSLVIDIESLVGNQGKDTVIKNVTTKEALEIYKNQERKKYISKKDHKAKIVERVEQHGIVFLDEIDKLCNEDGAARGAVSREGVQRDLLPIIEGTTVKTRYGYIKTDHILFICSGAFQVSKPSQLLPELQGRLPIRVELKSLNKDDFVRILKEPDASLTLQYQKLLGVDGVNIEFTDDGIDAIAQAAFNVNEKVENIGARRLQTVLERLMDNISFNADEMQGQTIVINEPFVKSELNDIVEDEDLSRYIL